MRPVYDVTGSNIFGKAVNKKFYSRDAADLYVKLAKSEGVYEDLQVNEDIMFSSEEEERMLAKIMHDCYLRGFEAGFNLREVKGNEQK